MVCSDLERASALLVRHTDLCFAHAACGAAHEVALTEACAQEDPDPLALHRLQTAYGLFRTLYRKHAAVPTRTYDWKQHQAVDDRLGPWAQRAKQRVRGTSRPVPVVEPGPRPALGAARALAAAPSCALGAALGRGPGPLGDLVVVRCTERVLARLPLLLARLHGCVGTVYVHEVCRAHTMPALCTHTLLTMQRAPHAHCTHAVHAQSKRVVTPCTNVHCALPVHGARVQWTGVPRCSSRSARGTARDGRPRAAAGRCAARRRPPTQRGRLAGRLALAEHIGLQPVALTVAACGTYG